MSADLCESGFHAARAHDGEAQLAFDQQGIPRRFDGLLVGANGLRKFAQIVVRVADRFRDEGRQMPLLLRLLQASKRLAMRPQA